ncbi:MAG: hypothetical protein K6G11_04000, partial [Lachnospiraceae bacterium]|nr:hypothetical protein [Lachnospiraceae bacterium]
MKKSTFNKNFKKFSAAVIAISMAVSGAPGVQESKYAKANVNKGDTLKEEEAVETTIANISTWDDLRQKLELNGEKILTLSADITCGSNDKELINNDTTFLDLNGHVINRGLSKDSKEVGEVISNYGNLNISDNSGGNTTHTIKDYYTGDEIEVKGGVITGGNGVLGSGIHNVSGYLFLDNVTICGNGGGSYGGAIYNEKGTACNIKNSNISYNYAEVNGGGIYTEAGESGGCSLVDSTVTDNIAGKDGGGLYVSSPVGVTFFKFLLNGTVIIKDNKLTTGEKSNLHLEKGSMIGLGGDGALAQIGISYKDDSGTVGDKSFTDNSYDSFVSNLYGNFDYDKVFTSDDPDYGIKQVVESGHNTLILEKYEEPETWKEFSKLVRNNHYYIRLTKDLTASDSDSYIEIPDGSKLDLDLNGHVLDRGNP